MSNDPVSEPLFPGETHQLSSVVSTRNGDSELERVLARLRELDPTGNRFGWTLRRTLDQLYDGQHTGRYRWDQLHKTEKTHCGTLVEINLHREFKFHDGRDLDYKIEGVDVDCKYSQAVGGWMIPPEALGKLCMVVWADDVRSKWSVGLTRIIPEHLNVGNNRDRKQTLNLAGRADISWVHNEVELPPNALLHLPAGAVDRIFSHRSGQKRLNELFRVSQGRRIGRGVVATVAQQDDYMKRIRYNGGSRDQLRREGFVILGDYAAHRAIAQQLALPEPGPGESVSTRLFPAESSWMGPYVRLDNREWRIADVTDPAIQAPLLPKV